MTAKDDSLLEFPCRFPIKAMGRARDDLVSTVAALIRNHAPDVEERDIRTQRSRQGNYMSITVTITATSREQLDNIYLALNGHEAILMTL